MYPCACIGPCRGGSHQGHHVPAIQFHFGVQRIEPLLAIHLKVAAETVVRNVMFIINNSIATG